GRRGAVPSSAMSALPLTLTYPRLRPRVFVARKAHSWAFCLLRRPLLTPFTGRGGRQRLKLVKRQMYGRAKLDLLQARLIGASYGLHFSKSASEPNLDADYPTNRVNFARRNTSSRARCGAVRRAPS